MDKLLCLQKRDGAHTNIVCSDGDKSSPTKSHYSPSNHLEENNEETTESRIQNYLNTKSDAADLVDMTELPGVSDDNYSLQEVPYNILCFYLFIYFHLK